MEKETKIRELWISNEEFQALEKCNSEIRYTYTIKRIADAEALWYIFLSSTYKCNFLGADNKQ